MGARVHRGTSAGTRIVVVGMIGALAAAAVILSAAGASGAPTQLTPSTADALTRPDHYIKNWHKRVVECPSFTHRPWVFWKTYAVAVIGDQWALFATNRAMCKPAKRWARKVSDAPGHGGAGATGNTRLWAAALPLSRGPQKLKYAPAAGMRCYAIPPSYEASYELARQQVGGGDAADAQSVGITASWIVCLSGGRLVNGRFAGSSFFVYGPLATSCELVYSLRADRPDPNNPGQMVPPPYSDARVWEDYRQSACS